MLISPGTVMGALTLFAILGGTTVVLLLNMIFKSEDRQAEREKDKDTKILHLEKELRELKNSFDARRAESLVLNKENSMMSAQIREMKVDHQAEMVMSETRFNMAMAQATCAQQTIADALTARAMKDLQSA